jgi:hypothetical protein
MNEQSLADALRTLTRPQRCLLSHLCGSTGNPWPRGKRAQWKVLAALLDKGLVAHVWKDIFTGWGRYEPTAGVAEACSARWGEGQPCSVTRDEAEATEGEPHASS